MTASGDPGHFGPDDLDLPGLDEDEVVVEFAGGVEHLAGGDIFDLGQGPHPLHLGVGQNGEGRRVGVGWHGHCATLKVGGSDLKQTLMSVTVIWH